MIFFQRMCVATAAIMLGGCNAAIWGNFVVIGIALGVFCGTLSLGDAAKSRRSPDSLDQSGTDQS
jgi:hypothetical protein